MNTYIFILAVMSVLSMTMLAAFTIKLMDKKETELREMIFSDSN